jgi:indolepyruvate ferredoxin oxidoreductase
LSYKDEYEVARLHTATGFLDSVRQRFGPDAKLRFHLAPPILNNKRDARGRPLKKSFGNWMIPVFRVLARLRRLRGTKLDVFGYTAERRMERALQDEFEETLEALFYVLDKTNRAEARAIVDLYLEIRGYGPVKEKSATEIRKQVAERLASMRRCAHAAT